MGALWVELDAAGGVVRRAPELAERLEGIEPLEAGLARMSEARADFRAALARRAGALRVGFGQSPGRRVFDVKVSEGGSGPRLVMVEVDARPDPADIPRLLLAHVEKHPDAVLITDPDGVMQWCDDDLPALVGWTRAELLGRALDVLHAPGTTEDEVATWAMALHAAGYHSGTRWLRAADGAEVPVRHSVSALVDGDGRVVHHVYAFQDLRGVRESERLASIARAADAVARLGERVAHELNETTAELVAVVERGLGRSDPEAHREALERALLLAGNLGELGRRLLSVGSAEGPPAVADLGGIAADVAATLRAIRPDREVRVEPDLRPIQVLAQTAALTRVALRFGLRALDGAAEGPLRLLVGRSGDRAVLELAYAPARDERASLGWLFPLGGASPEAHRFLEPLMGTEVRVEVRVEAGEDVRVLVSAPVVGAEARDSVGLAPAVGPRLLVVEDHDGLRELVVEALGDQFAEHVAVNSAEAALLALEEMGGDVAVAVVDLQLPGRDGLSLLRELRDRWPGIATVVSSGLAGPGAVQAARAAGARAVLRKPYRLAELRRVVRDLFTVS